MFNFDYTKTEKFFFDLEKQNNDFDARSAFTAVHQIASEMNSFKKAQQTGKNYDIFEFNISSKLNGKHGRTNKIVLRNLLNVYQHILLGLDSAPAVKKAQAQFEKLHEDKKLSLKAIYHYKFALIYLAKTNLQNIEHRQNGLFTNKKEIIKNLLQRKNRENKTPQELHQESVIKQKELKNALMKLKAAEVASSIVESIFKNKAIERSF